jgi:lipopolysaccharide/colanic/teichoic acid biosynthesis glycosyltransferase
MKQSFYTSVGKRCFDLTAVTCGLILFSPVLLIAAVAVKLSSPGPIFFRQNRVGRFGKPFRIFKFRSMRVSESGSKVTASRDPRITPLGSWLRRTKLDEFPQLFNVILGDMSVVGPRPEVPEFVAHYTESQRAVLSARPGLVAPSAILREEELLAGREDMETFYVTSVMPAKLEIDVPYCKNISFQADLHILYRTLLKLSSRVHDPFTSVPHPDGISCEIPSSKK